MNNTEYMVLWNSDITTIKLSELTGISKATLSKKASALRSEGFSMKYRYPPREHYVMIGAKGGKLGRTGGFAADRELARRAGSIGGRISKRGKNLQ